jgi:hypothetical protein
MVVGQVMVVIIALVVPSHVTNAILDAKRFHQIPTPEFTIGIVLAIVVVFAWTFLKLFIGVALIRALTNLLGVNIVPGSLVTK